MKIQPVKDTVERINGILKESSLETDDGFLLEFNSEGELSLKGCSDIGNFSDETVLLVSKPYYINVKGRALQIKIFSKQDTVIAGTVENIGIVRR